MKDDDVQIENLWIWHLYLPDPSLLTNDGDELPFTANVCTTTSISDVLDIELVVVVVL